MRLFISAPLPKNIKRELAKVREEFLEFPTKWVEEENLHITLIFIGETKTTEAEEVAEAIDVATKDLNLINLETDGLSLLPNEKRPRVLTVKLVRETEKLSELAERIKKELREERISFDEKPFRAHITLGRLKRLKAGEKKELKEKVRSYELVEMCFTVKKIELTKSQLTPTGPIYFAVAKSERIK